MKGEVTSPSRPMDTHTKGTNSASTHWAPPMRQHLETALRTEPRLTVAQADSGPLWEPSSAPGRVPHTPLPAAAPVHHLRPLPATPNPLVSPKATFSCPSEADLIIRRPVPQAPTRQPLQCSGPTRPQHRLCQSQGNDITSPLTIPPQLSMALG